MILKAFLQQIDRENLVIICLYYAKVAFDDLLYILILEFHADPQSDRPAKRICQLHRLLDEQARQNRQVVLIIDEAQYIPIEILEGLCELSNVETPTHKLLQVIFRGQPEFFDILNKSELIQRISVRANVMPLTHEEAVRYVQHRLSIAGAPEWDIFTKDAIRKIFCDAQGILRLINILCENALVTAYGYQEREVTVKVAKEIIADHNAWANRKPPYRRPVGRIIVGAVVLAGVFLSAQIYVKQFQRLSDLPQDANRKSEVPIIAKGAPSQAPAQEAVKQVSHSIQEEARSNLIVSVANCESCHGAVSKPISGGWIVKSGDWLMDLVEAVYGVRDEHLVQRVKQYNPQIKNVDVVRIGEGLTFPPRRKRGYESMIAVCKTAISLQLKERLSLTA
jgi:general secretion pathway protein A